MALIPNLIKGVLGAIKTAGQSVSRAAKNLIEDTLSRGYQKKGHTVADVVQSIKHADPERIATQLNQTARTTARLISTEEPTMRHPWDAPIPRNLLVSGRLKSARRFRIFAQADVTDPATGAVSRKWISLYSDDLKTFEQYAEEFMDLIAGMNYEGAPKYGNLSFHHVMYKRGSLS